MLFLTKIWTISQPISAPRRNAFQTPPLIDMCAPNFKRVKNSKTHECAVSQCFRLVQQHGHTRQQASRRAAVEHAMVETECQVRFGHRDEFSWLLARARA